MKTTIWLSIILSLAFWPSSLFADGSEAVGVVNAYIDSCKTGNVEVLKPLIAGPFLERRKLLLEKNREYSDFLKEFYKNIAIEVVAVDDDKDANSTAVVVRQKPLYGRGGSNIKLILRRDGGGPWLIFDEQLLD